jgi:hypothetical protein
MMNALTVTSDLAADNSVGVRILDSSTHPTNSTFLIQLNLERTSGWAIMRTGAVENGLIHGSWSIKDQLPAIRITKNIRIVPAQ